MGKKKQKTAQRVGKKPAPQDVSISKIFKHLGYKPHPGQIAIHNSGVRNRVVGAGRRFGKSELGASELDVEAVRTRYMLGYLNDSGRRREFWIVGPEYTDAEKEFRKHYDAMRRLQAPMDRPGTYYDPHSGDLQLSMFDGKYLVLGKSAMHPERLVGEGINGVIMAEAAKQKESTWVKFIRPMLADFNGWSLHSSTPEGKNWFYDLFQRGLDPDRKSWESWRMPAWANPYVYPQGATDEGIEMIRRAMDPGNRLTDAVRTASGVDNEIIELMEDLAEETFNQEIGAMFTEFAGRVFQRFDDEYHVRDIEFDPDRLTYACVDYGYTNPFVWLLIQVDLWDNVYVVDEFYQSGLTIDDAAREVWDRGLVPDGLIEFYPDPASPGDTKALQEHFRVPGRGGTGGELNTRLRYIREGLKDRNPQLPWGDPERYPKLQISRRCVNLIREMNDYRYPATSKEANRNPSDLPMKKDDHAPEALGRFYVGHYGPPEQKTETRPSTVRRARMTR